MENQSYTNNSESSSFNPLKNCKVCSIVIPFLVLCLLVMSFALGVLWTKQSSGGTVNNNGVANEPAPELIDYQELANDSLPRPTDDDFVYGNADAKVSIIEYSDFECPFCQAFHPTAKRVVDESNGSVNWIFRHYPLDFHPLAMPMAEASECIAEQLGNDAFWKFADAVAEQKPTTQEAVDSIVNSVGVNRSTYDTCISEGRYKEKIAEQMSVGTEAGVQGTPGNFVYNSETDSIEILKGAVPYEDVMAAISNLTE